MAPDEQPRKEIDEFDTVDTVDEGDAVERDGPDWDPTGLDLARSVAGSLANAKPNPTRRSRARRKYRQHGDPDISGPVSSAGPDDRDPQMLESTIGRLIADRGWTADVAVAGAIARWDQIVGPDIAAHCRAESYADAVLSVRADSTAWATQVRLLAPTLVRRLNEDLGDGTVIRVVVLGPVDRGGPGSGGGRTIRGGRGPRDTYG